MMIGLIWRFKGNKLMNRIEKQVVENKFETMQMVRTIVSLFDCDTIASANMKALILNIFTIFTVFCLKFSLLLLRPIKQARKNKIPTIENTIKMK